MVGKDLETMSSMPQKRKPRKCSENRIPLLMEKHIATVHVSDKLLSNHCYKPLMILWFHLFDTSIGNVVCMVLFLKVYFLDENITFFLQSYFVYNFCRKQLALSRICTNGPQQFSALHITRTFDYVNVLMYIIHKHGSLITSWGRFTVTMAAD